MATLKRRLFRDRTRSIGRQDFSLVWHSSPSLKLKKSFTRFLWFWQVEESLLESLCKLTHSRLVYPSIPFSLPRNLKGYSHMGWRRSEWQSKSFLKACHFILPMPAFFRSSSFLHLPLMTNLKRHVTWYEEKRWKDKEKSLQRQKRGEWDEKTLYLYCNLAIQSIHGGSSPTLLHFNTPEDDLPPSSDALKHRTFSANKFTSGFQSRCGALTNTSFITSYFKSKHTLASPSTDNFMHRVLRLISTNQSPHKMPAYPPFHLLP